MDGFRWLSLVLAVLLLLNWPLALAAEAQQQTNMFQEALKASGRQPMEPGSAESGSRELSPQAYEIAAGVATAVNVPGRAVLCTTGAVLGFVVLVITFGSGYRAATRAVEEGCQGPWTITAEDLKGRPQEPMRPY